MNLPAQSVRPRSGVPWRGIAWAAAGLVIAVWFVGTHMPADRLPHPPGGDKFTHFAGYLGHAFLLCSALQLARPRWGVGRVLLTTLAVIAVVGAVDELTQPWFGRACELADWLADVGGATAGATVSAAGGSILRRVRGRDTLQA
jgi:VanZ family protein